ncbi:PspA/IM30 family protein [Streptomyces sp. NPDC002845]
MEFIALVTLTLIIGGAVVLAVRRKSGDPPPPVLHSPAPGEQPYDGEARGWVERLGSSLSALDAGDEKAARQALTDAEERLRTARSQLTTASASADPARYVAAKQTAIEGLHCVRAARIALFLHPGPPLPDLGTGAVTARDGRVTVAGETYTVSNRPGAATPHYYPGGVVNGRKVPGGWYSLRWWTGALVVGAV